MEEKKLSHAQKRSRRDVFHAWMMRDARYAGELEIPRLRTSELLPERLVSFEKAMTRSGEIRRPAEAGLWVHFYTDDRRFERLWNNPKAYLARLKRFTGIITPDFSLYRDMPLVMQAWNTYRGRALGHWLAVNGIPVIPNVRWGDERTYSFCFDGIEAGKTVAVSTYGCLRGRANHQYFQRGLEELVRRLQPPVILVHGSAPDTLFAPYRKIGGQVFVFASETELAHRKELPSPSCDKGAL